MGILGFFQRKSGVKTIDDFCRTSCIYYAQATLNQYYASEEEYLNSLTRDLKILIGYIAHAYSDQNMGLLDEIDLSGFEHPTQWYQYALSMMMEDQALSKVVGLNPYLGLLFVAFGPPL